MYTAELHQLLAILEGAVRDDRQLLHLLFVPEQESDRVPQLMALFREKDLPLMGGVFPGIIHQDRVLQKGFILKQLPLASGPYLIKNLPEGLAAIDQMQPNPRTQTGVMLVDGISPWNGDCLDRLYDKTGGAMNFIGGGAGRSDFSAGPCLFTAERFVDNAALLACLPVPVQLGVAHGWLPADHPPVMVTATDGPNCVTELEWEPATAFYRRFISDQQQQTIDFDALPKYFAGHPFGFAVNGQYVVRDVVGMDGSGLHFAGKVRPGTRLQPMKGEPGHLLQASPQVAEAIGGKQANRITTLVFDCISRAQFLGEAIGEELHQLGTMLGDKAYFAEIEGALTIGEIAQSVDAPLEFYNKTLVAGHIALDHVPSFLPSDRVAKTT